MTINFCEVQNNDEIFDVVRLAEITWREHYKALLSDEQIEYMLQRYLSFEAIKTHIERGEIFKLIRADNANIGFTAYDICDKLLFLDKLYILKEFRHLGIGKQTIDYVENFAKGIGKKGIYLTVNKYNLGSIKAYKSYGFSCEATAVTDIGNGFVMDDFRMYKFFKN